MDEYLEWAAARAREGGLKPDLALLALRAGHGHGAADAGAWVCGGPG